MTGSTEWVMEGFSDEPPVRVSRHLLPGEDCFRVKYRPISRLENSGNGDIWVIS